MHASFWPHSLRRWLLASRLDSTGPRRGAKPPRRRFHLAPRLEALEDRLTPSTLEVSGAAALQSAIVKANQDNTIDTILLDPGTYNLGSQLTITAGQNLTIKGNTSSAGDAIIDGGHTNRVFNIQGPGSVTFQNLTIQHGMASEDGTGNTGTAEGGGILAAGGGNVALTNVVVQSNTAQGATAAPAEGGGIFVQGGLLDISNSVIRNNSANGGFGGLTHVGSSALGGGVCYLPGNSNSFGVSLNNTTVSGNSATGGTGAAGLDGGLAVGGGIDASGGGTVDIFNSTLSGNIAEGGTGGSGNGKGGFAQGGGASLGGPGLIINSTIAENAAYYGSGGYNGSVPSSGGGLDYKSNSTTLILVNVTVVGNKATDIVGGNGAPNLGGGIDNEGGTVTLINTLVALNTADALGPDYFGNVQSGGHNLIGNADGSFGFSTPNGDKLGSTANPLNPHLGQLQFNGGPTQTIALLPGSLAIDNGSASNANSAIANFPTTDQRGLHRIVGNEIDIGAYEYQPPETITTLTVSSTNVPAGQPVTLTATVTGKAANSNTPGGTVTFLDGSTPLGTVTLNNGTATLTTTLPAGPHDLSAKFNGSSQGDNIANASPSNTVTITVTSGSAAVGPLMLFGFGFGPNGQLDLFEVDQQGEVFALAFTFANFLNPNAANAQLVNTDMVMQNMSFTQAGGFPALLGSLEGSNHQSMLMMTVPIELMSNTALLDVIHAWQAAGG